MVSLSQGAARCNMFQSDAAVLVTLETPPLKCEMLRARLPSYSKYHRPFLIALRCASCSSNPFGCWLSSAPVQLSLDFSFGVRVGATVHLPIKRCRRCKGDVPTPPASTVSIAAASGEQVGGLAWELQKRIGEPCLQPLMFFYRSKFHQCSSSYRGTDCNRVYAKARRP